MRWKNESKKIIIALGFLGTATTHKVHAFIPPTVLYSIAQEVVTSSAVTTVYHYLFHTQNESTSIDSKQLRSSITIGNLYGDCAVTTVSAMNSSEVQKIAAQNSWLSSLTQLPQDGYQFLSKIGFNTYSQAVIGSYLLLNGALLYEARCIKSENRLMNWQSEKSLAELLALPQELVGEQLLQEFTNRYSLVDKISLAGALHPFLNEIESEIALLNRYCSLAEAIMTCSQQHARFSAMAIGMIWSGLPALQLPLLQHFFAIDEKILKTADEKRVRLQYIKTTLLEYLMHRRTRSITCF